MRKVYRNYVFLSVVLVIIALIVGNCGGGNDTGTVPNVSGNSAQTQNLVSKEVSGYIFWAGSIPSPEGGNTERFIVLDNPLTGEESFLTELSSYLQEEVSEAWASSEVQAIYSQLSSEMAGWKSLKEWNGNANLYTIYQDSKQTSPLQVGSDGYFSGTVLVSSADDNVRFEVIVGDNEQCYSVEAISSAEISTSESNATELVSCPQIILNFPGWCTLFAVRSLPDAINLKDAGLSFTLNDGNLGCVSPPVYLKCGGKRKYEVAYGIFYANPGISTPSSTTITAQTTTGLILNIFTEVIGSCASIEGHVGGAGVVPFAGFVYSLGWNAFDCLDGSGNYKLNAVFKGHFRKVVAVYWVQVNGHLVKYREERTIDFFNGNLTGFDLPEGVQPTPTVPPLRPITDPFYSHTAKRVMMQKDKWAEELGIEQAVQKTVQWLNGEIPIYPVPEGIASAIVADDPVDMRIIFTDGRKRLITSHPFVVDDTITSQNFEQKPVNNLQIKSSKATTVGSDKVVILAPFAWQNYTKETSVYYAIWNELVAAGYQERGSKCKATKLEDIDYTKTNPQEEATRVIIIAPNPQDTLDKVKAVLIEKNLPMLNDVQEKLLIKLENYECEDSDALSEALNKTLASNQFTDEQVEAIWDIEEIMVPIINYDVICSIKDLSHMENIIIPEDFQDLSNYGVIYIATHGFEDGIALCPMYTNASFLDSNNPDSWLNKNEDTDIYDISTVPFIERSHPEVRGNIEVVSLNENFFASQNFSDSLVFLSACESFNFLEQSGNPLHNAKTYLGFSKEAADDWSRDISYYLFLYMIEGYVQPVRLFPATAYGSISDPDPLPLPEPMSVQKALDTFSQVTWGDKKANPDPHDYSNEEVNKNCQDCELKLKPLTEEIYFPVPVTIIVEKDK